MNIKLELINILAEFKIIRENQNEYNFIREKPSKRKPEDTPNSEEVLISKVPHGKKKEKILKSKKIFINNKNSLNKKIITIKIIK